MQKVHIFLIVLITTVGVLVSLAAVAWYLAATAPSYYGSSWMEQMWGRWGGMMGGGGTSASSNLWVVPVLLIAASAVAVIGVVFYLVFPELRYIKGASCSPQIPESVPVQAKTTQTTAPTSSAISNISTVSPNLPATNTCYVLLKTMTPEEQKVLNVLISHQGKYLQKYLGKEAGLNRLKTHRIIARFAQRGIVTVTEYGNTNEVLLADWVKSTGQ